MRTYEILQRDASSLRAIKRGFSWPALLFGAFWLLAVGLWWRAAVWAVLLVAVGLAEDLVVYLADSPAPGSAPYFLAAAFVLLAAHLALVLTPGVYGNAWRRARLSRRGYVHVATVAASSRAAALAEHLRRA